MTKTRHKQEISANTLSVVQSALGYEFQRPELLCQSLTHKSAHKTNNERLEFLGDAVLETIISLELFSQFSEANEGQLTRARAQIVKRDSLAESARRINLGAYLSLGEGEVRSGGSQRSSILADALEALIGAVYIDGEFHACQKVVLKLMAPNLRKANPNAIGKDAKTELQEYLQKKGIALPKYEVGSITGPDHNQTFTISCIVETLKKAEIAQGHSKQDAEQTVAKKTLEALKKEIK